MSRALYLTRQEWGGYWIGTPPVEKMPDGETYIHHVGGAAFMGGIVPVGEAASRAAAIRVFRGLNEYAQRPKALGGKGYQFLDYDVLVWYDRFNDIIWIAEGRGQYRSAATLDRNEEGEAIVVCGNFQLRNPLPAEIEGAALAAVYAFKHGWVTRDTRILGHRDNPAHPAATACPGDRYYPYLSTVRRRYSDLMLPPLPPPLPPTPPMEVIEVITYDELENLWIAPSVDDVADGGASSDRWLNAVICKVGAIADVQRQNDLKVTGRYDQPTATVYARLLGEMKQAAGV